MASSVTIDEQYHSIEVTIQDQKKQFSLQQLPTEFIKWQIEERLRLFGVLEHNVTPGCFTPHLPILITLDQRNTDFFVNAVCKGIGLVPTEGSLEELTDQIQGVLQECDPSDFAGSIRKRIEGAMFLYGSPEKIHRSMLGGLEIFGMKSFQNIKNNPCISLFFVGSGPQYLSYQINCIAEIIPSTDRFYTFMISMRQLFEQASFHYQQPTYPYAVRYHVVEVLEKSLKVRGP